MMNKHKRLVLVVLVIALSILACQFGGFGTSVRGSGDVVEESRPVSGVTGVELATLGNLFIEVGDTESLRIEAEDNLMEYIETDVRNGTLRIDTQNNVNLNPREPVNYFLTVTTLDSIEISSSGDIQAPDLEAESFSIRVSSSGDLMMGDLEADTVSIDISSSGDVTIDMLTANTLEVDIDSSGDLDIAGGEVVTQNVTNSSSGKYNAQDMDSSEADVRLSSSGSVTIRVSDHLEANLSSSGDLRYIGNPTVDATTSSSGDVIQISD
jgi:hypothetical protein